MQARSVLDNQLSGAAVAHRRRQDLVYRSGFMLQAIGSGILAALFPIENPFYSVGIMVLEAGILLSAIVLSVRIAWIKYTILIAVGAGLALQAFGIFAPEHYAGDVILTGIGLVCAGGAGVAGKEAYCFGFREGWLLVALYPVILFINLSGIGSLPVNALAFSALFLLILSLAGKKLKQPLHAACATQAYGSPAKTS